MKTILIALAILAGFNLNAQYITPDGEVNRDLITADLKQFPDGSADQLSLADSLAKNLLREISRHPVLQNDSELKSKGLLTVHHIKIKLREFTFLRKSSGHSSWQDQRKLDTISVEALAIESQIKLLNDSLYALYDKLIDITQRGKEETRATKEKAALMIGKSPFYDHIEYIFENHTKLVFGFVMDQFGDMDTDFGVYRSGMLGLISGLVEPERNFFSWRTMPFLLKYWGDPEWTADLHPDFEALLFINLTANYDQKNLLLEFMKANAEDADTPVYRHLSKDYFTKKD